MDKETKAKNIWQRMSEVSKEIGTVAKNLKVVNYKAVSESDILRAVNEAEQNAGLVSYQSNLEIIHDEVLNTNNRMCFWLRVKSTIRIVNVDNPTEFVDVVGYGDGMDSGDKSCGKAATYAGKYALMKAYKIPTGDDPDQERSEEMKIELATAEQIKIMQRFPAERIESMYKFYKISSLKEMTERNAAACIAKMEKNKETKE